MPNYVAKERLYLTADRSEVVKEGDPRAATLLAAEGTEIAESEVKRLRLQSHFEEAKPFDTGAYLKDRMEDAVGRGAYEEAQAHQAALGRHELAAESGGADRAVLEAGRARQPTGAVPTPRAERASTRREAAPAAESGPARGAAPAGGGEAKK